MDTSSLIGSLNLGAVLEALARTRPVFHSEADFQHHLAWTVRELDPLIDVRLETRPLPGVRQQLDVRLHYRESDERVALELKYPTRSISVVVGGEAFALHDHAAQDIARYDICKDVSRVENFVATGTVDRGFVLVITNDQGFWNESSRTTVDAAFRLHEGRQLAGSLAWAGAAAGTMTGRSSVIELLGTYRLAWRDFSHVLPGPGGRFRVLQIAVGPAAVASRLEVQAVAAPQPSTGTAPIAAPSMRSESETVGEMQRLQAMIDELRSLRNRCEPKTNTNPRYLRYSNAVSNLKWIIDDLGN
jgi:hypothetical protein